MKIGLDDFLVATGGDLNPLWELSRDDFENTIALWRVNDAFAYLHDPPGTAYRFHDGKILSQRELFAEVANWPFDRMAAKALGATTCGTAWWKWQFRRELAGLEYAPGEPDVLNNGRLNLWSGWGAPPDKGDVSLWNRLLDHLFRGAPAKDREWYEQWIAYQVQYPGTKLFTAVVLVGRQGCGKSLSGECFGHVLGDSNWTEIGEAQLTASFNPYMKGIQFVLANEVVSSDSRADANKLKNLITRTTAEVNEKFIRQYNVTDHVNYMFTSNNPKAVYINNDDRRYFIHHITHADKLDVKLGDQISAWAKSPEGRAALHYYLKFEVDCSKFNPHAEAPHTLGKEITAEHNRSLTDRYARDIMDNPRLICGEEMTSDLVPIEYLVELYEKRHPTHRIQESSLITSLSLAGAFWHPKVVKVRARRDAGLNYAGCKPSDDETEKSVEHPMRPWAIADVDHWRNYDHAERAAHIREQLFKMPPQPPKRRSVVTDIDSVRAKKAEGSADDREDSHPKIGRGPSTRR